MAWIGMEMCFSPLRIGDTFLGSAVPTAPPPVASFQSPSHRGYLLRKQVAVNGLPLLRPFQSPSHRGYLLRDSGQRFRRSGIRFQSPSHRGYLLRHDVDVRAQKEREFQSPSHRGYLLRGGTVSIGGASPKFQSPSHRGYLLRQMRQLLRHLHRLVSVPFASGIPS